MDFPFKEKKVGKKLFLREFSSDVDSHELVWHQDKEDRKVKVLESNGWQLQMDNELPILLKEGTTYSIPAYEFHRVIKGSGKLKILVEKNDQSKIEEIS
jgi:hypothetical protein|tara:strand:- start:656 stop:952 length:297 start_codon:yes stop_codon:yes gene_type:complete